MPRFGRDDWLVLGLAQLAAQGPDGMRIDALCAAAGRTRGSFYHHFRDQAAFVSALLDHWRDWNADAVIEMVELEVELSGGRGRLNALAAGLDSGMEAALRRFAASDRAAAAALADVDEARIAFLARAAAEEHGIGEEEARRLAEIEYAAFIGYRQLYPEAEADDLTEAGAVIESMIAAVAGSR